MFSIFNICTSTNKFQKPWRQSKVLSHFNSIQVKILYTVKFLQCFTFQIPFSLSFLTICIIIAWTIKQVPSTFMSIQLQEMESNTLRSQNFKNCSVPKYLMTPGSFLYFYHIYVIFSNSLVGHSQKNVPVAIFPCSQRRRQFD